MQRAHTHGSVVRHGEGAAPNINLAHHKLDVKAFFPLRPKKVVFRFPKINRVGRSDFLLFKKLILVVKNAKNVKYS